jgi:hypothetical protein
MVWDADLNNEKINLILLKEDGRQILIIQSLGIIRVEI